MFSAGGPNDTFVSHKQCCYHVKAGIWFGLTKHTRMTSKLVDVLFLPSTCFIFNFEHFRLKCHAINREARVSVAKNLGIRKLWRKKKKNLTEMIIDITNHHNITGLHLPILLKK